jgi:hypothetical protein
VEYNDCRDGTDWRYDGEEEEEEEGRPSGEDSMGEKRSSGTVFGKPHVFVVSTIVDEPAILIMAPVAPAE